MIIEITEEERNFLEKICHRAEVFCYKGLNQYHPETFERDLEKIRKVKEKFKKKEPENEL